MKVLVTGGSGFLGKHLCRALAANGHEVLNLDKRPNSEVQTVQVDITDSSKLDEHVQGNEVVFHLASLIQVGESVEKPEEYLQNNVIGTLRLLESMRKHNVRRLFFSSSAAVYGEPLNTPVKEDDRTLPTNPYGVTKLAMEGLLSSYVHSYGFSGAALRYFNLYGPGEEHEPETHAVPRFITQIARGDEVTVWGDGSHRRDFVYIDDVVRAHMMALQLSAGYQYLNLSGKNATSVLDLIHMLENIIGKKAKIQNYPPRSGDPVELFADATKAKQVMGWESEISLEDGLRKTVEWFALKAA